MTTALTEGHSDPDDLVALLANPRRLVAPRARTWWLVRVLLGWTVPATALVAWAVLDGGHRRWQLVAAGVVAVLTVVDAIVEPQWRYRVHRWDVTDAAVLTRTGWLTQERRIAPISRVQTVDVERGPLARLFGLASVRVTTASAQGPVEIEGLDLATAERLTAHLTAVTARTRGDAT